MVDITFIRANVHDVTGAIPRAIEACAGVFGEVRVLCWNRSGAALDQREVVDGVEVRRFTLRSRPRSFSSVLNVLRFGVWVIRELLAGRPRWIQVCDLESALPAALACVWIRSKLIYDMRDPFAESYRLAPWLGRAAYALDWMAMSRCTAFVVPSAERVSYLGRWGRRRPVCIVRNTCHDQLADLQAPPFVEERQDASRVRLAYLGYLVPTRGAPWLLEACRAEAGALELWVAGLCRSEELGRSLEEAPGVRWFGLLPRPEALGLMREADGVTLLYDTCVPVNRIAAPNKYYEALMAGTPVLVSRGMSLALEVEREGLGFVLDYGDVEGLRDALEKLRDPQVRRRLGRRCRQYYLSQCLLAEDLERYREFYRALLASRDSS